MLSRLTIIIPAHNRPERLQRLLGYYAGTGARLLVPDSSDEPYTGPLDQATTTYLHRPRLHFLLKLREVLPMISTPYVVYCADDDFAVPEGLRSVMDFLDASPAFSIAQGHYLTFTPLPDGRITFLPRYIRNFESRIYAPEPLERLASRSGIYASPLYSVARTEDFRHIYSRCFDPTTGRPRFLNLFLAEEYFMHAMLIRGSYATVPCFYSARERIPGSATSTTVPVSVVKTAPEHRPQYDGYITALATLLSESTGITVDEARTTMRRMCDIPPDKPSVMFKRRINAMLASHPLLRPLERLSEWRYARKGLRAVRDLSSYPCSFSTPEKEKIIAAVRSTPGFSAKS